MKDKSALLFYSGTLISSIGSMAFNICLLAFMLREGHPLFYASLIIGLSRLIPVLISIFWGQLTDQLPPKMTVIISELFAAAASFGILLSWNHGKEAYLLLLLFCVLKASVVTFQTGSRAKITKLFSDSTYASNSKHAVWYNKATQGATLFAGLFAWLIIVKFSFTTAIFLDMTTFLINGIFILFIKVKNDEKTSTVKSEPFYKKFLDFYHYNPRVALLDLFLCISMMGTVSFMARLSGPDEKWNALFMAGYGFAVWFSGIIERGQYLKNFSKLIWIGLAASFIVLGLIPGQDWLTLFFSIVKDIFYWILFHRISTYIQMDTPQEVMGSVSSARMIQIVTVLALGEISVGAWQKYLPVFYDGLWRGIFCLILVGIMMLPPFKNEVQNDHPKI